MSEKVSLQTVTGQAFVDVQLYCKIDEDKDLDAGLEKLAKAVDDTVINTESCFFSKSIITDTENCKFALCKIPSGFVRNGVYAAYLNSVLISAKRNLSKGSRVSLTLDEYAVTLEVDDFILENGVLSIESFAGLNLSPAEV